MSNELNEKMKRAESVFETPIGPLRLVTEGERIIRLHPVEGELLEPSTSFQNEVVRQLQQYFEGLRQAFDFEVDLHGTEFQQQVWNETRRIDFGKKRTYGELARAIGKPQAARAVGRAMGQNPILILVPCHRVVAFGGQLGGFSGGGVENKKTLLSLESST